jgi:hypothetical protein
VALTVEAIDHDPVVACERLENAGCFIAEGAQRGGPDDGLKAPLEMAGEIDRGPGALQFNDNAAALGTVDQTIEGVERLSDVAPDAAWHFLQGIAKVGLELFREVAVDGIEPVADGSFRQTKEKFGVFAGLDDHMIGFPHQQDRAVRLN